MSTTKNNFYENVTTKLVSRRSYGKVFSNFKPQDLLEIQRNSYDTFLKKELPEVIKSYFPISHPKNPKYEIIYNGLSYAKEPIVSEKLCHEFSKTYEKAVYVDVSLINRETGEVKREDKPGIFFGKIPLMTSQGTFLINGTEKIIISQIIRSPGVYALSKSKISLNKKKKVNEGNILEIFPSRGNLSNIFIDKTNIEEPTLKIMIRNSLGDAAPTFYVTTILKAFGLSEKTILDIYDSNFLIKNTLKYDIYNYKDILVDPEIVGLINSLSGKKSSSISNNAPIENKLRSSVSKYLEIKDSANKNKIESALDVVITEKAAKDLILGLSISTRSAEINFTEKNLSYQNVICATFMDKRYFDLTIAGRRKIQRKLKISERLFNNAIAEDLILTDGKVLFQKNQLILKDEIDAIKDALEQGKLNISKKINFSEVCDIQKKHINSFEKISISIENNGEIVTLPILGVPNENNNTSLTTSDFIAFISYLIGIPENVGCVDDKDHIGNKRLRLIHEQLRNVLNQAMARVNKFAMDKLASASVQTANDEQKAKNDLKTTVKSVINTKPFQNSIHAFFNTYQLTQYVGQENPLSELTNKRRVSAMGIGGISRDDPNLDIRDIHHSYYGRICPTESPEGANIGLINSLALYAKVDEETGFITSPYHKVVDGKVTEEIEWLNASDEESKAICEATVEMKDKKITQENVICRFHGAQEYFSPQQVEYMDITPQQVVSASVNCIPFVNSDDGVRSMYGCNMQRQALPLIKPYAPIVGTGVEYKIAHDSGAAFVSKWDGTVEYVDGKKIMIKTSTGTETVELTKFSRSNQDTCINHTPIVCIGDKVKVDDILADGPAMQNGELSLGRNVLVAFTTWHGYNFEDAIIISNRLVHEDVYTTITINEYKVKCMRTLTGDEEITRDIPNTSTEAKSYLNESGIINIGAEVKEGDILVGKITPKGQVDYTAEEKLLHAIFGDKANNYRDSSLKVPHGGDGIVFKILRNSLSSQGKTKIQLEDDVIETITIYVAQKRKVQIGDKLAGRHGNKGVISIVVPQEDMPYMEDGTPIDILLNPQGVPSRMNIGQVYETHIGLAMREIAKQKLFKAILEKEDISVLTQAFGIIEPKAKILFKVVSDYFKEHDITTYAQAIDKIKMIDYKIIMNKAGVEIEDIGYKMSTPAFSGATYADVVDAMEEANLEPNKTLGKFTLTDGRTGEKFEEDIAVGVMYIMKLNHMVDDKLHARSIGPYSKITQQPLGGKRQKGGRKFGEMEVWALEAYGASHALQEILTIKSDDVHGRNYTYNNIIKGKELPVPGIPESFKLLSKQLQGLCIGINVVKTDGTIESINTFSSAVIDDDVKTAEEMAKQAQMLEENVLAIEE